jgi:hypothetical protein
MLLLLLAGCASQPDTGPARDSAGCWTDGREAYELISDSDCAGPAVTCRGMTEEGCLESYAPYLDLDPSNLCFDGCKVDACIEAMRKAEESCDESEYLTVCFEEAVYQQFGGMHCEQLAW